MVRPSEIVWEGRACREESENGDARRVHVCLGTRWRNDERATAASASQLLQLTIRGGSLDPPADGATQTDELHRLALTKDDIICRTSWRRGERCFSGCDSQASDDDCIGPPSLSPQTHTHKDGIELSATRHMANSLRRLSRNLATLLSFSF